MNHEFLRSLDAALQEPLCTTASWIDLPLLVYGAGGCGQLCATVLGQGGCDVIGFIDRNPSSCPSTLQYPVYGLGSKEVANFARQGCAVVLGVFNHFTDVAPIEDALKGLGFDRVVTFYEFCDRFEIPEAARYWVCSRSELLKHADDIRKAAALFSDSISQQIFMEALQLRLRGDIQCLRSPDLVGHYAPDNLPQASGPIRLVDGGAYTGDTLESLQSAGFSIEAVAAFEPDPTNYEKLIKTVHSLGIQESILLPCGLGSKAEILHFSTGMGEASAVSQNGSAIIQIVSLDGVIQGFNPSLIKLDIEGSEVSALQGMGRTLRESPNVALAVCAYHRPSHFWEVPLLMHKLVPKHSLHLRSHGYCGFDLVAYAYPTSRN